MLKTFGIKTKRFLEIEMENLYANGKIYKITCPDNYYYIGSTRNDLKSRLTDHKKSARLHPDRDLYKHILQIGWPNITIELIEVYSCASKKELNEREDYYIKNAFDNNDKLCLNINRAIITKEQQLEKAKEYREQNKEQIAEYKMVYRQLCADKIAAYNKEYVAVHADAVKERKCRYRAANADHEAAVNRKYVEEHRAAVNAYKNEWARKKRDAGREDKQRLRTEKTAARKLHDNEILTCACSGTYQSYRKSRHDSGKKHAAWAKSTADHISAESKDQEQSQI